MEQSSTVSSQASTQTNQEVLVRVQGISKKYCRDLKKSLWYGVKDVVAELLPFGRQKSEIRNRRLEVRDQSSESEAFSLTSDLRPLTSSLRDGEFWAVKDVSFELRRGECLGLIGRNGAGKTTLLKMLNGLIKPDEGSIEMRGRVGALIALGAGFNPILSGRENVYVNGSILGLTKSEIDEKIEDIIDFAEIREFIDSPVQSYSSGMQVRLGFAVATALNPDILILDEVLAVGDVGFRMKCYKRILDAKERGTSMILVSHNMVDISRVCDRIILFSAGEIEYSGSQEIGMRKYEELLLSSRNVHKRSSTITDAPKIRCMGTKDSKGCPQTKFASGDSITVNFEIESKIEVSDLRLVIHIVSSEVGILGSFASPSSNTWFKAAPTNTYISLQLQDIPLLKGTFQIYASLYGLNVEDFYDELLPAATISITDPKSDPFGFGYYHSVNFKHEWHSTSIQ